jgi:dTDP-4-amino-4,6-dideoxygalactose transaminase
LHAALGVSQMQRLDAYVNRRHAIADRYDEALSGLPVTTPLRSRDGRSGLHLYIVRLQLDRIARGHREVFESLRERGVGVNLHYIPVHMQPWYAQMGFKPGDYPEAERYYAEAISLPMFPALTDEQQDHVVAALAEALSS